MPVVIVSLCHPQLKNGGLVRNSTHSMSNTKYAPPDFGGVQLVNINMCLHDAFPISILYLFLSTPPPPIIREPGYEAIIREAIIREPGYKASII